MNKKGDQWLQAFKMKMRKNPTHSESVFRDALENAKIKFRHQSLCYTKEFQCIVDFFIKSDGLKLAIEIDGEYHFTPKQIEADQYRTQWLKDNRGYDMLRFTNKEVNHDINECLKKLAVYYLNTVKSSESRNYSRFCAILGIPQKYTPVIKFSQRKINKQNAKKILQSRVKSIF